MSNQSFNFMPPPTRAELSQWFTPSSVANLVAEIAEVKAKVILEPSCGSGNLIAAIHVNGARHVEGFDVDEKTANDTRERFRGRTVNVLCRDFLTVKKEEYGNIFDVVVINPPYENNQDLEHVLHALRFAPIVVALVRLSFLSGKERKQRLWDKVNLLHLEILSTRPSFDGPTSGSPLSDFCIIKISKKTGEESKTTVNWF